MNKIIPNEKKYFYFVKTEIYIIEMLRKQNI